MFGGVLGHFGSGTIKRHLSLSWLNADHTNLLRENQTHDIQNYRATLGQLKKKKSLNKCLTPPRSSWGKSPGSRKSPAVPLLLCCRIYSKQMWLWSAWSGEQNSLVLSLEVLLDEAVLGPGLLGRDRVGTRCLVSSTGTLRHKGRSPWTQRRVRVLSKFCDVALKIMSPDKLEKRYPDVWEAVWGQEAFILAINSRSEETERTDLTQP